MEYQSENKTCQNCKQDFTIESDDFAFYEKIKVPPPTFCPECRMVRRMCWRNERSLHKRECGKCGKGLISMYCDEAPVYCMECWSGDYWDQHMYSREYDFNINFFEQLWELFKINPRLYAYKFGTFINSEYVNYAKDDKNCHLSFSVIDCEDILYSTLIDDSKNCADCLNTIKIEHCYENTNCEGNYNSHFMFNSQSCVDSFFLYDCTNCSNCFMSSNLRSQQYVFRNQKLTKEKYKEEMEKIDSGSHVVLSELKNEFRKQLRDFSIHKFAFTYSTENSTGDYIHHVKNVKKSFDVYDSENVTYSFRVLHAKDSIDNSGCGYGEMVYESMGATMNSFKDSFCYITIQGCRECEYSLVLKNCSNCFACVGLTNASYCILNKQYSKEEYFATVNTIKKHMNDLPYTDMKGRVYKYGEFFPMEMSPFGYNETNAHDFFPLRKTDALVMGYNWLDRIEKNYTISLQNEDLPENIESVTDAIVDEVIDCPNRGDELSRCISAYRITKEELQFLRQRRLPLPRYCPNCRHYERLSYRNPLKLWHRLCMCDTGGHNHEGNCPNEFETSYAPDRPEKVYCESCYQKEVL